MAGVLMMKLPGAIGQAYHLLNSPRDQAIIKASCVGPLEISKTAPLCPQENKAPIRTLSVSSNGLDQMGMIQISHLLKRDSFFSEELVNISDCRALDDQLLHSNFDMSPSLFILVK